VRIPVSWLAEHLPLPEGITPDELAEAFVRVGLEVEDVRALGPVTGPLVIGRVSEIEELTGFKKPIRFCRVEVGEDEPRGIICGATNFVEGDLVIVALPGCVLPDGFAISARPSYGRVSDGMICSVREVGLGEEHAGILVLPSGTASPGDDGAKLLGLDDFVIELSITPDRGYCLSVRGLARELACAFDLPYGDPATGELPAAEGAAWPVRVDDEQGCPRYVVRRVTGVDPTAPTPWWMRRRLLLAGMRSISLAVDVTNYVMLETGQPLHAFDTTTLRGGIVVRRAKPGEKLSTLDGLERDLDEDDVVVCDDRGPVALAGVMGGAETEVRDSTADVLLEAATFDSRSIARTARRHKLPSEASRRFERVVDPALPSAAAEMAAQLLQRYGDGSIHPGRTDVGHPAPPDQVTMPLNLPDQIAGVKYAPGVTVRRLGQIGCRIDDVVTADDGTTLVMVTPPTWRSDLRQPVDLVEEVMRLEGYDAVPSILPAASPGRGITAAQRRRRAVSGALANAGYVEVLPFPFTGPSVWDALGLDAEDVRRRTVTLLNPLEADRPELATTLLPGLFETLRRNTSRGYRDLALFHVGQVVLPTAEQVPVLDLGVEGRPTDAELATLGAALPQQPVHVAVVLAGNRERPGWWGPGREVSWADAVEAARVVAAVAGVELRVVAGELAPWHPGRCAELRVGDRTVGHAGELHSKVVDALGLPPRTAAMELDLDALPLLERRPAPSISPYPPVLLDVALVVDEQVPAAEVTEALRGGAGDLLEDVRLFDVYTGEQVGTGKRSLAFALRLRASDRTLTVEEATTARDAAVSAVTERFGATLRG
jgi:phenylalanyl-tRNA synthetase beta chain